jgi:hypothetical protein
MSGRRLTRGLAALFPSLAVLSSAHELYLRNQQDLDRTLSVLHPFWAAAALTSLVALLLQRAEGVAPARAALVAFYTAGFAFVAWSFARALPAGAHFARWVLDSDLGASLFVAAWLAATVGVARRREPRSLEPLLAMLTVALLANEVAAFATHLDRRPPPPPRDLVAELGAGGDPTLPNVYHLLFDALQDDLIEHCLPPGARETLDGFVRFRATAPMRSTMGVLPAILTGRWLPPGRPEARIREALRGKSSLLSDLRGAGYRTVGLVPRFLGGDHRAAFDLAVLHGENLSEPDLAGLHAALFLRRWAYGTIPRGVGGRLAAGRFLGFDIGFFGMGSVERLSTYPKPVLSRLSMESLVELEPRLPARGRYTFVHLLLPHNPYLLRADCSRGSASQPADLAQQTECALLLLQRFLATLRSLGRLEDSVVLVHGDHGSGEAIRDGRLVPEEAAWLRTVILFKPKGARGPMRDAAVAAGLVDIAPTLLALLGIERESPFDGRVLREALPQPIGRTARAGTPATSVRGGTSAVTTLPAATKD